MSEEPPALHIRPPDFLAGEALRRVLAALPDARVVGGAVRDALAGARVTDIDLATPSPPDQIVAALGVAGIRAIPTGLAHGTVTAWIDGEGFEVTTLRRDVSTDGRRATVAFTDDWASDAARRDFTINAMSMSPSGDVFDYFGGIADLRAGIVRFVGDPATRIAEDYLRILRYFRFQARYAPASAQPDPVAMQAIRAGVAGLDILSPERVWSELGRILEAPLPAASVSLMAAAGVLQRLLPGADADRLARLQCAGAPAEKLSRLAALLTGGARDGVANTGRLRLSGAEHDRLAAYCQPLALTPAADDDMLRRALANSDPDTLAAQSWITALDLPAFDAAGWARLRDRMAAFGRQVFPLEGRDVLALGLSPGPQIGVLLQQVRAWWLARGCLPDATACRAELARQAAG